MMDKKTMIGQRLCTGFPSTCMSEEFKKAVHEYKIGNVILFKHNISSKEQLKKLCADIQAYVTAETGYPALISIDQEGGVVSRLPEDATIVPGTMALAATGNPDNAYEASYISARELSALGVNFNLAPDMDVNSNKLNPVIGVRSFGDTPETVRKFGTAAIAGFKAGGVLCCAKHFPGHGDTDVDSHIGLPKVDKSMAELEKCELAPFAAAIDAGVDAIMTTHILFPQLEKENIPATMSRDIITGLLKEKMGFGGIVVSDCMMMQAIAQFYGTVKGTLYALHAGVDLVYICHDPALCSEAAETALRALDAGELSMEEMCASAEKLVRAKARVTALPKGEEKEVGCKKHIAAADRMADESICACGAPLPAMGAKPLFLGCAPFRATLASNAEDKSLNFANYMKENIGGDAFVTSDDPTADEITEAVKAAPAHTCLVVGTYNGHMRKGQMALVDAMAKTGLPCVCVALRNPYDLGLLPENAAGLAAWQYSPRSLRAVARVLKGEIMARGVLPVKV